MNRTTLTKELADRAAIPFQERNRRHREKTDAEYETA